MKVAEPMPVPRYAVYFVPAADTPLYRAGAALIGYDVYGGGRLPFPPGLLGDHDAWSALTAAPRVYGFHATLKAPFRLAPGTGADELARAVFRFAGAWREDVAITLSLAAVGGRFAALVPDAPCPALQRLAAACVRAFEAFRAPLNDGERRRRLAEPLTPRQRQHLERWGYPHVFEDFRFHMTLTGPLAASRQPAVFAGLRSGLRTVAGAPVVVDRIALVHQSDPDRPFRVIASAPFAGRHRSVICGE